jgi:hypothetical protein
VSFKHTNEGGTPTGTNRSRAKVKPDGDVKMDLTTGTACGAARCDITVLSERILVPPAAEPTPHNVIATIGRYRENYRIIGYLPDFFGRLQARTAAYFGDRNGWDVCGSFGPKSLAAGRRIHGDRLWEEQPGFDHLIFYCDQNNRPAATVSMPYLDFDRCVRFVRPFAEQHGLTFHMPPRAIMGWHWPHETAFAVIQAAGASEPRWMVEMS